MKFDYQIVNDLLCREDRDAIINAIQRLNNNKTGLSVEEVGEILKQAAGYNNKINQELIAEAINSQGLPSDQQIAKLSQEVKEKKEHAARENRIIKEILASTEVTLVPEIRFDEQEVKDQLVIKNDQHHLFQDSNNSYLQDQYIKAFRFSKFIADHVEKNNTKANNLPYQHAYKLVAYFVDIKLAENQQPGESESKKHKKNQQQTSEVVSKAIKFLAKNIQEDKPLQDCFVDFSLPKDGRGVTLDVWQNLIQKNRTKAMTLFARADDIEKQKAKLEGGSTHIPPKNLEDAQNLNLQISYERALEYPEMAQIFNQYKIEESVFDKSLDMALGKDVLKPKTRDNLPNITINGNDIEGINAKGYFLVKLPHDDPRSYILGKITNCCQSITILHPRNCVIDGITRENNGFYVLLKGDNNNIPPMRINGQINYDNYKIVGEGYAWLSRAGNLTFDSWENLRGKKDEKLNDDGIIAPMLQKFAEKAMQEHNISRVTIGLGGRTPESYKTSKQKCYPESMLEGYGDSDARQQVLLIEQNNLTKLKKELEDPLLGYNSQIISIEQAEYLKNILLQKKEMSVIASTNSELIEHLTSFCAVECYKKGYINFNKLQELKSDKILALTSSDALECYEKQWARFDELKDLDTSEIKALTSFCAVDCYKKGYISFNKLQKLKSDKILALTSSIELKCYEQQYATFDELKDLDTSKIKALTSFYAVECYEKGYISFNKLIGLKLYEINALTSLNALKCYKKQYVTYDELKDLDTSKIDALTSSNALECYERQYARFDELKDLNSDQIKALTSPAALMCYKTKRVTGSDLKDLDTSKIKALTSFYAVECYEKGYISFNKLIGLKLYEINALTSLNAMKCYKKQYVTYDELKDLDTSKIDALTSSNALECYERQYARFDELKDLDTSKIDALTSSNALKCYERQYARFDELKDLNFDQIKALNSFNALECYKQQYTTYDELKGFDTNKIDALTSLDAQRCYARQGVFQYITFNELKDFGANEIRVLISPSISELRKCLIKKIVTINDLKDFTAEEIKSVSSCIDSEQIRNRIERLKAGKPTAQINTNNTQAAQPKTATERLLSRRSQSSGANLQR